MRTKDKIKKDIADMKDKAYELKGQAEQKVKDIKKAG